MEPGWTFFQASGLFDFSVMLLLCVFPICTRSFDYLSDTYDSHLANKPLLHYLESLWTWCTDCPYNIWLILYEKYIKLAAELLQQDVY